MVGILPLQKVFLLGQRKNGKITVKIVVFTNA